MLNLSWKLSIQQLESQIKVGRMKREGLCSKFSINLTSSFSGLISKNNISNFSILLIKNTNLMLIKTKKIRKRRETISAIFSKIFFRKITALRTKRKRKFPN